MIGSCWIFTICLVIRHYRYSNYSMSIPLQKTTDGLIIPDHQPFFFHGNQQIKHCSTERLRKILSITDRVCITVTGTSMLPFIPSGSRIVLQRVKDTNALKCGDIILFSTTEDILRLHRIVATHSTGSTFTVLTKGDNRFITDTAVSADKVIAKMIRFERKIPFLGNKNLDLESIFWKMTGRVLAKSSRRNIHLRGLRLPHKLKNFFSNSPSSRRQQ